MSDYRFANEYVKSNSTGRCDFPDLWDLGQFKKIDNGNVAAKLLDMADMFGYREAIKMLQDVLNQPLEESDERFPVDGIMSQRVADAVAHECRFKDGDFALMAALVSACEDRINELSGGFAPDPALMKRAERLP